MTRDRLGGRAPAYLMSKFHGPEGALLAALLILWEGPGRHPLPLGGSKGEILNMLGGGTSSSAVPGQTLHENGVACRVAPCPF